MLKRQSFCLSLWKNLRNTWLKRDSFPSPLHLWSLSKAKTYRIILFLIQSKTMHTSITIPICTSATGTDSLLAWHDDDHLFHTSDFCSKAGESALPTELSGGRWCVFSQEHKVGTVESELHSSRLGSEDTCSRGFLFYITLSKSIQIVLGLFLPMQRLILL